MDQLELFGLPASLDRLTVEEGFALLWKHHLGQKPSARPFNSNRRAICRNLGGCYFDALTEPDICRHLNLRTQDGVGPQTIRHDMTLLTMLFKTLKKWKKRLYTIDGIDFSKMQLPEENPVEDIKKPKTQPRKVILSPNQFSLWIEHCAESLKVRSYFAMDTGLSPIDLKALKTSMYNAYTDCLDLQRHKTGKTDSIPISDRCRPYIFEAIQAGRALILDWTNHDKQVEAARKASGLYFWFGRDIRKTFANAIYELSNYDSRMGTKALLHSDPRTFLTHYRVETGRELRPLIQGVAKKYTDTL